MKLLILLNPGNLSRHYMIGLARAAGRSRIPHVVVDVEPIWRLAAADPSRRNEVLSAAHGQFRALVENEGVTHVLGYAFNGADFGMTPTPLGPRALFAGLGCAHLMLWTDHPEWCLDGAALDPTASALLGDVRHIHVLKSASAADEAATVLGWPNVHAMAMAEDYELLRPATGVTPRHDLVAIIGGCSPMAAEAAAMLEDDDPDPRDLDGSLLPRTLSKARKFLARQPDSSGREGACLAAAEAMLALKVDRPLDSFWRIARTLESEHGAALAWLRADARRWYGFVRTLRTLVEWRRNFTVAWLARRADVGVYGCDASPLGIEQLPEMKSRVPYERQAEIYARGRTALNVNAAHDEEGCSHKPFQIAASAVPCIHSATRGLTDLFEPGREIATFDRPAQALRHLRELASDRPRADALAAAMLARAQRDHTWESRLRLMLERARIEPGCGGAGAGPAATV